MVKLTTFDFETNNQMICLMLTPVKSNSEFIFSTFLYKLFFGFKEVPTSNILPMLSRLITAWCCRRLLPARLAPCHVSPKNVEVSADVWWQKNAKTCADVEKKCSHESDGIGKMLQKMVSIWVWLNFREVNCRWWFWKMLFFVHSWSLGRSLNLTCGYLSNGSTTT